MERNFPSDVLVRGGGGFDPIEDQWKVLSHCEYPSEGVADLIPLGDKISQQTHWSEGGADWLPLEGKWQVISY